MNLMYKIFEVEGIEVKFEVEGSAVTVWAYLERVTELHPRPSWIEIANFDVRDFV